MKASRFMAALIILLAALGADLGFGRLMEKASSQGSQDRLEFDEFPPAVGSWRVEPQPLRQSAVEMLDVDDYLYADFVDPLGGGVSVYVGYYTNPDRATQHPPTICYPGGGWTNSYEGRSDFEVAGLDKPLSVNVTVFERDGLKEIVIYWYSIGGYMGADAAGQKVARVMRVLAGKPIGGASKIQIAMDMETSREEAEERLEEFLSEFLPALDGFIPGNEVNGS